MKVTEIKKCRACSCKQLDKVFDLGEIYPSNFVRPDYDIDEYDKAPLVILQCCNCGLIQLKHTVEPDTMYKTQYWYKSSLNKSMVDDLKDIAEGIEKRIELKSGDIVVDIGCNDGTLFKQYLNKNIYKLGFDPAPNIKEGAEKNCTFFVNDYFSEDKYPYAYDKAKVITSIAMFYDLENPNTFINDVKNILDKDGIWVIQMTDLVSTLLLNCFDNFCHEHLCYYSLKTLNDLLEKHKLRIFNVEWNAVNGGSLRIYVSFPGAYPVSENVEHAMMKEYLVIKSRYGSFISFGKRFETIRNKVLNFLLDIKNNNKIVFGMGASTKGNTLLQKYSITKELIPFIVEVNKDKFGKVTLSTDIPIIPEDKKLNPDFYFILPWHFIDMLLKKHSDYLAAGGKFIVPLPIPTIYSMVDGDVRKEFL